ncbi:PD-(D/E)XK nuclease family protein [Alicyclobacillus herbarius]|uniref:PD-(D/E)XK nuclease family protein n=1 Tax=Alicyclobacillus herbarius TaxID=122960 RepID=UPI000422C427|nr:PD-(D/E)XK nuclease family protein [Alicyclobacillus herbarius]
MAKLEVWAGPAGSGKSWRVAAAIREQITEDALGPRLFWLVPEAMSYTAERALLSTVPASLRAEVLSIRRLAGRVVSEVEPGLAFINRTGKRLLLAAVYQECLADLQVLHRVEPSIAFLDAILDTFRELTDHLAAPAEIAARLEAAAGQAGVLTAGQAGALTAGHAGVLRTGQTGALAESPAAARPDAVGRAAELAAGRSLYGKLRDLCLLYVRYRQELDARGLADDDDLLLRAVEAVPSWPTLAGAQVFVDGFSDMSPAEREFVLTLAQHADRTVVTLPVDLEHPERGICPTAERLLAEFKERAEELCLGISIHTLAGSPARFQDNPDLAVMERFALADDQPTTLRAAARIQVAVAQNRRVEADSIAGEIARLVHQEGMSYADVAVIVPHLEDYAAVLEERFAEHQIPCQHDVYPPLASHPLARFTLAALSAVEEGCSLESMLRLIRTPFCTLSMAEADWLEMYLVKHEVEGVKVWQQAEPWTFSQQSRAGFKSEESLVREDQRADDLRRRLRDHMLPFFEALSRPSLAADELARQLWDLFERVDARAEIARWLVAGRSGEEDPVAAGVHEQAWQKLLGLLDDFAGTLPGAVLPRGFLFQLVRAYLQGEALATIPSGLNRVVVSDMARAAGWERKVVFLVGATDGALPLRVHETGLLRQEEREQFQHWFGRRLGGTLADRRAEARAQAYFALTRATERLYFSYPLADAAGRELRPSRVVERTRQLFADGSVPWTVHRATGGTAYAVEEAERRLPSTPAAALADAVRRVRQRSVDPLAAAVLLWHLTQPAGESVVETVYAGLRHRTTAAKLPPALAKALFGHPLTVNVYQLETFAACPYRHFVEYGLKLQEEETADVTAAFRGALMHDALDAFVARQRQDLKAWRQMGDEDAVAAMRAVFAEVLAAKGLHAGQRQALRRQQALSILAVLEDAAVVLTRHLRYGRFAPSFTELSFGDHPDNTLPAFEVADEHGRVVRLRGRIDRVDVVQDGETAGFRVLDYKSSVQDLDLTEVAHGLRLQLPVYTAVVGAYAEQLFGVSLPAAGMVYVPIHRKLPVDLAPPGETEATERSYKEMRSRGWLLADADLVQAMDERAGSQATDLFPAFFKQDGSWRKTAPVLSPKEWQWLLGRALGHVVEIGARIQDGEVAIAPYDLNRKTACQYCPYHAVCHIDRRWDARPLRRLEPFSRERMREWAGYAARTERGKRSGVSQ